MSGDSLNYEFLLDLLSVLSPAPAPRVLDFGCGQGRLVALGRERGLDIVGADTFVGGYHGWGSKVDGAAAAYVSRIVDDRLDYPSGTFDVVISNTVFEHVPDPRPVLREIDRVLKPGGAFLAFFPTRDVWYEGHVGVYFVHRLQRWPRLRRRYLTALRSRGAGLYGAHQTTAEWVASMERMLDTMVSYHSWGDIRRWWRDEFGVEPHSLAAEYVRHRIGRHPRLARWRWTAGSALAKPVLAFVCHRRAGRVLLVRKAADATRDRGSTASISSASAD